MNAATVLRALGPIDLKSVKRDPLLRWMVAVPLFMALMFRFGVPPVERWLAARFDVALGPYEPLLASVLVMTTPMMYAVVIGFLLLDQKDDRTLAALEVTPLTARGYLTYRLVVPTALSVVMTMVALMLSGLSAAGPGAWLLASVGAAPLAPAYALFLPAFARNKVQGFALMKAAGVLNWPPVIAYFVHSPWQWAFGICPTYWPAKLVWELERGGPYVWPVLAAGTVYAGVLIVWLAARFDRTMHR